MRIALLSDIHGNLVALQAVIEALEVEAVDQIICLGDVAIFGPQPSATLAYLRQLACPIVMGNTDAWVLQPTAHPTRNANSLRFNEIELWGALQLTLEDRLFISTFPSTLTVDLGEDITLLCYHGSPRSYDEGITASTPTRKLNTIFAGHTAQVMAGGHTHTPMVRPYGDKLLVNPGSVGVPYTVTPDGRSHNPPWAEYMILAWQKGQLHTELRRALIDVEQLAHTVKQAHMPHGDWWMKDWG